MSEQQPQQGNAGQNVTPVPQQITWNYIQELLSDSAKYNALSPARRKEIAAWMVRAKGGSRR